MASRPQFDELPVLNLTSLIDVLFLLIIFFMVGTQFIQAERQIELQVPQVSDTGALTAPPAKRVVNVYPNGEITLDDVTVTLEELTQRLALARSQYQGLGVLIRGDGGSRFQQVATVLGACRQAGVVNLGISVRLANKDKNHARN